VWSCGVDRMEKDVSERERGLAAFEGRLVDVSAENRVLLASTRSMEESMREAEVRFCTSTSGPTGAPGNCRLQGSTRKL
jgi:hypothetical protein